MIATRQLAWELSDAGRATSSAFRDTGAQTAFRVPASAARGSPTTTATPNNTTPAIARLRDSASLRSAAPKRRSASTEPAWLSETRYSSRTRTRPGVVHVESRSHVRDLESSDAAGRFISAVEARFSHEVSARCAFHLRVEARQPRCAWDWQARERSERQAAQ